MYNVNATELIEQTDDRQWDEFVARHERGWLTHTTGWQDVLETSFGHIKGRRFAVVDRTDDTILAGIPVYTVSSLLTGKRLVSVPFATMCDPLATSPDHLKRLVGHLIGMQKKQHCRYLELRSSFANDGLTNAQLTERPFFVQHSLRLDTTPEALFKTFHRTCTRQRINRAKKSDLHLLRGESQRELKLFYELYTAARKRLALPPMPYHFLKNLWATFFPKGQLELLVALKDQTPIAAIIVFTFNRRVSIEFAASDDNYWQVSPNHFLFWEAIQRAHAQGAEVVDFGRTSPTNTSLMDFKRRWGTQAAVIPQYYYPADQVPQIEDEGESLQHKVVQYLCRKAPVSMLPAIGKFCYRHLG
jgi:hypothetical protein